VGASSGLAALFQMLFFGGALSIAIYFSINTVVASVWLWSMLMLVAPSIIVGLALVAFRGWSRGAGIVLSVCELVNFPLGTILGLYGLWVLFSDDADMLFSRRFGQSLVPRR
jgi:hypothetical protein